MECIAIKEFITFILVLTMIRIIKCSDDWPTYLKKDGGGSFQRCYECPPGYYLIKECPLLHNPAVIDYSTCGKCPEGQFSQRWNHDPRCWDHTTCGNGKVDICNAGNIGPTECGCAGKTHEENGQCVESIPFAEHKYLLMSRDLKHEKEMKKVRSQFSKLTISSSPSSKTDAIPVSSSTPCITSCPPQPECSSSSLALPILLGVAGGALMFILMSIIRRCKKSKKRKKREQKTNGVPKRNNDNEGNATPPKIRNQRDELIVEMKPLLHAKTPRQRSERNPPGSERSALLADQREQPETSVADSGLDEKWDKVSSILEKRVDFTDLETFLRHILELDGETCNVISEHSGSHGRKIQNGVKKYREKKGIAADFYELLRNLRKQNRNDIADDIVGELDIKDENKERSNLNNLDEAFKIVENGIAISDARHFFRQILPDQQLNAFEQVADEKKKREGLRLWRNDEGRKASVKKLSSLLRNQDYNDIADQIDDLVNNEGDDLVNNDRNTAGSVTTRNVESAESGSLEDKAGPERHPGVIRESQSEEGQSDANSSGAARPNPNPSGNTQTTTVSDGQDDDDWGIKYMDEGEIEDVDYTNEKPDQGGKAIPDDGDVQMAEKDTTQKSECGVPIQETIPKELYEGGHGASSENETTPKELWKDNP